MTKLAMCMAVCVVALLAACATTEGTYVDEDYAKMYVREKAPLEKVRSKYGPPAAISKQADGSVTLTYNWWDKVAIVSTTFLFDKEGMAKGYKYTEKLLSGEDIPLCRNYFMNRVDNTGFAYTGKCF